MNGEQIMYEIFAKLLEERGVTPYQVFKATGVAQSSLSDWKNGKSKPKYEKMVKIADYFNVSVNYLLTGEEKENTPVLNEKDRRDAAKEVKRIMDDLENSGELMFDGVPLSDEARESLAAAMKLGLEAARLKNKETYTPKKYRK
ncbi:putative Xre family DNA-binding protein [Oscillibacter valericigenes Sjm18-20]|nr:putative Xre family DNA-binding protein [Oscillibacter valericigenes Sjm18-20]